MKTKMPKVGIVIGEFPSRDARKESVHYHQLLNFAGKLRSIGVCNHQADIVPDDPRLGNAERLRSSWTRIAAVFMSRPSLGIAESPIPGRSGAMTVNLSVSLGIKGRH